jgi:hypothetical protein
MTTFERDILDRSAATELILLAGKILQNNFSYPTDCLSSLCRSIALLEMTERIPEVKSLDVVSLIAAMRQGELGWIPESMKRDFERLRTMAIQHPKGEAARDQS